jgi:Flp pilus assembly protein TadG
MRCFSSRAREFFADRNGSTAMLFAGCLVPALLTAGMAVDYSRAQLAKTRLRAATDGAALAAAGAFGIDSAARMALAQNVFASNTIAKLGAVTPSVSIDAEGVVSVSASLQSGTSLLKAVGIEHIDVAATSRAQVPMVTGEIAMVLDYSSSMTEAAGNGKERWEAMRDAAIDLINRLKNGQANPDLKFGLVPFAGHVYLSLPGEHVLGGTAGVTWTNCTRDRKWPYVSQDATPTSDIATKWGRTDSNDTIGSGEYSECPNYASRGLVLRPLGSDHAAAIGQLQSMTPYQGTNISIGMSLGWHVISPNAPFSEGAPYGSVMKTIILLTDGEQTVESFGTGNSYTESAGEQNLADMCSAIKAQGVRVITVAFSSDVGSSTVNRLETCASPGGFFYNPNNGEQLAESFQDMAHKIGGRAVLVE